MILLVVFAGGFCGGYQTNVVSASTIEIDNLAQYADLDSQESDCDSSESTKTPVNKHTNHKGTTSVNCCSTDLHHNTFNKNANSSTSGNVKLLISSINNSNTPLLVPISHQKISDSSLSPPSGWILSSVIKKE